MGGSGQSKEALTAQARKVHVGIEKYSEYKVNYYSPSGKVISVPPTIDPYQILGVSKHSSRQEIKNGFLRCLTTPENKTREDRVVASLSYFMITSKSDRFCKNGFHHQIAQADIFLFATVGDTKHLMAAILKDKSLLSVTNEHQHTVLYLAARSGYHDTTLALLKAGAPVNHQQVDGSTPLHGASFYDQREIVEMLLEYGANPAIKNRFGNTPAEEARDRSIKEVFEQYNTDNLVKITGPMIANGHVFRIEPIQHNGKVIAKQIHRRIDSDMWANIKGWDVGWHGTKANHLASIFTYGLQPSGTKLPTGESIKPPPGHIGLNSSCNNIDDWSQAIFVSPSMLYSSHGAYAEEVTSEGKRWRVIVMTRVKPGCYTTHAPTVSHSFRKNEPVDVEHRIEPEPQDSESFIPASSTDHEKLVIRVKSSNNVVVTSAVFVSVLFLEEFENNEVGYKELEKLFCAI